MRYGILTFHNIPNIGALLQAQALCEAFRMEGVNCDIIDYTCDNIYKRELQKTATNNFFASILQEFISWPKTKRKINACNNYMRKRNLYTSKHYAKEDLLELNSEFDAFISGSDMIWNLKVTNYDWTYMCSFVSKDKKRYAYGSSIGDKWKSEDYDMIKKYLSKYSSIAVREQDTAETIKSLGIKCSMVADPTMLMTTDYWKNLSTPQKNKNYVLVYFPTTEIITKAMEYAQKNNLSVMVISNGLPKVSYKTVWPLDPPEWISLFLNAVAVFTNSYHGLLFSLYFNKPVWTANYGNRISSLLERFDLKKIMLKHDSRMSNAIDYSNVNKRINAFRQESLLYIRNIIKDCQA